MRTTMVIRLRPTPGATLTWALSETVRKVSKAPLMHYNRAYIIISVESEFEQVIREFSPVGLITNISNVIP
jgi:hypothetical protein